MLLCSVLVKKYHFLKEHIRILFSKFTINLFRFVSLKLEFEVREHLKDIVALKVKFDFEKNGKCFTFLMEDYDWISPNIYQGFF